MQLCRVGTPLPRTRVHMQGSLTKHTCPHARRGGHLAANPKKVPGLTRPPSRRFAWAFAGLGCSAAGMRASLLPEDELEADADEGGRECLPVVVMTTRPPAAGGAPCAPSSLRTLLLAHPSHATEGALKGLLTRLNQAHAPRSAYPIHGTLLPPPIFSYRVVS